MPLTLRPTGLAAPVYKHLHDYEVLDDGKRPANDASQFVINYENVGPLTGKLMGTLNDGYSSDWA
jgi:hypothetical protein